jgi:uncharacterized membrane protein
MMFLPLSFLFLIIFILLLPFLFFLVQIGIVGAAFAKLGISPRIALIIIFLSLLGSAINIPIIRRGIYQGWTFSLSPSMNTEQVICMNLGGAIIPLLLCIYLFPKAPLRATIISTLVMIMVAKMLTRVVPGVGFTLPALIPPLVAAPLALILAHRNPAPVAYISGVLGTLIGADLLNLYKIEAIGAPMVSIGGAGVYDGIYLVGIMSVLLTF